MWTGGNVSWSLLGEVLSRVAVNTPPVISRASIVDGDMLRVKLPLSEGSVNKATTSLLARGLLIEDRSASLPDRRSGGTGRPPVPLRLNGTRWFTIGVHVDEHPDSSVTLTGVATSIDDQILTPPAEARLGAGALGPDHTSRTAALADAIAALVARIVDGADLRPRRFPGWLPWLGVGVAIGSPVHEGDTAKGTGAGAGTLQERLVDLLNIPVVVDNDANALAVRETYGARVVERDFALIGVADAGVGSAFTVGGRVYRGSRGRAGEIGHMTVSPRGGDRFPAHCRCEGESHVETYATPAGLRAALLRLSAGGQPAGDDLIERARAAARTTGERDVTELFRTAGEALGRGVASLIDVINPAEIIAFLPPALTAAAGDDDLAVIWKMEYREALELEIGRAFSKVPREVRAGREFVWDHHTLARAAGVRVFIEFIDHLCGLDGCLPVTETPAGPRLGVRDVVPIAGGLMFGAVGAVVGGAIGSAWFQAVQRVASVPLDDWSRGRRRPAPQPGVSRLGDAADLSRAPF